MAQPSITKPGPSSEYKSHRQSVPSPEEADAPPSYEASQLHTSASTSSPAAPSSSPSAHVHGASYSPRSSASTIGGENTPLQHRYAANETTGPVATEAYHCPQPMTAHADPVAARRAILESQPACCCSDHGACCFSDYGGCLFSSNGGCMCSDNEACCFSDHRGCCFSDHGGCCFNFCPGPERATA